MLQLMTQSHGRSIWPCLCRLKHRHFLRPAADRCAVKQVKHACLLDTMTTLHCCLRELTWYSPPDHPLKAGATPNPHPHPKKCALQAMRFVQLLPRRYADTRTYNMLVTVCAAAGDVTSALHAADMLRSTGGKPDTIMYTNLIAGARPVDLAFAVLPSRRKPQL